MNPHPSQFCNAYARHRAGEGRGYTGAALMALPYLSSGPLARQWTVRARSFEAFVRRIVAPMAKQTERPLDILDLGAGNGWLCRHLAEMGHHATALDMRDDRIDGLGAAEEYLAASPDLFARCVASFEDIPLADGGFDIALFNASLHYAQNLQQVLGEAARVTRAGGVIVILDSPFYACEAGGEAMVTEKRAEAAARFGSDAPALLSLPCIEYLTPRRLAVASEALRLTWFRQRVSYPLWYEARPFWARLKGRRAPSRFDLWWARLP